MNHLSILGQMENSLLLVLPIATQQSKEKIKVDSMPTNRKAYYHEWRNYFINNLGNTCIICDSPLFLHVHHEEEKEKRQNRGGHDNLTSWKREFNKEEECCLLLLCEQCHLLLHIIKKLGSECYH